MERIKAPDGTFVDFPDGTSDDVIQRVMAENYPAPQTARFDQTESAPKPFDMLPLSEDNQGNISFDSNAGILGSIKRGFNLPGEVARGEIDPLSNEGVERSIGSAMLMTPATPAMRSGSRMIPGVAKAKYNKMPSRTPTSKELLSAGVTGFKNLRKMNVDYSSKEVAKAAELIKLKLESRGLNDVTAKKTFTNLDRLSNPPENSVATIGNLHTVLKTLKNTGKPGSPDRVAAGEALRELGKFIKSPPKGAVLAGPASKASGVLKKADANYAAGKRSGTLTDLEKTVELRAAAANSGRNIGNATRGHVASMLKSDKMMRGFNASERGGLENVVTGTPGANMTRYMGNLLGGGGGIGQMLTTGAAAMAGGAAGAPGIGAMAGLTIGPIFKGISNKISQKALKSVDQAVRQRSPLYQEMAKMVPMQIQSTAQRQALIKALMMQQMLIQGKRLPNEAPIY